MATDSERMLISIQADIRDFSRAMAKMQREADKAVRGVEQRFARSNPKFGGFGGAIGQQVAGMSPFGGLGRVAGPAAVVAGLTLVGKEVVNVARKYDDLADSAAKIGLKASQLQTLQLAAQQLGSELEDVIPFMTKFNEALGEAQRTGTGNLANLFRQAGISLRDANGEFRSTNDMLLEFSRLVQAAPTDQMASDIANTVKGGRELVNVLRAGPKAIGDIGAAAKKAGIAIDDQLADSAGRFVDRWNWAATQFGGIWDKAFLLFIADINDVIDHIKLAIGTLDTVGRMALLEKEKAAIEERLAVPGGRGLSGFILGDSELADVERLDQINAEMAELRGKAAKDDEAAADKLKDAGSVLGTAAKALVTASDRVRAAGAAFQTAMQTTGSFAADLRDAPVEFQKAIFAAAQKYGIDPNLLASIAQAESGFRQHPPDSPAGAQGPFQFIPGTARQYGLTDPYDVAQSADAAAHLLSDLLRMFSGNIEKAIAAYNAGPGAVQAATVGGRLDVSKLPTETQGYLPKVLQQGPDALQQIQAITDATEKEAAARKRAAEAAQDQVNANNERAVALAEENLQAKTAATTAQLDEMRSLSSDVLGGIVSDLRAGADAGEVLANVLDKIISKLADMAIQQITAGLFGAAGTSSPGLLGSLFAAPAAASSGLAAAPVGVGLFAEGGNPPVGMPAIVGEKGPELIVPRVPSTVIPHGRFAQGVDISGGIKIEAGPMFHATVGAIAAREIAGNNRRMPSYLAERQRRGT